MGQGSTNRISPLTALAFTLGILGVQGFSALPPWLLDIAFCAVGIAALIWLPRGYALAWCAIGFGWAALCADEAMQARLPRELEGHDVLVSGRITGLPQRAEGATRFFLDVANAQEGAAPLAWHGRVRVSWYAPAPDLLPCETWRLTLRLKRPRGLLNPGGFDAERHALEQGVVAMGYVRDDEDNSRVTAATPCVDGLRWELSQAIAQQLGDTTPVRLLRALAVGDQGDLDDADWQVLRATGVGHLIAISGLHVGLLAALGALLTRAVWKLFPRITLRVPGPLLEAPAALVFATAYAALAGFGLPTTRTLLMIAVLALARWWRRSLSTPQGLALSAMAILSVDPLGVLSAGFWLSFVGVAFLMLCLGGTRLTWWRELGKSQAAMSLGLLPLSAWFFGQSSFIGPVANLIAVPFVSFVIVPLVLLGSALIFFLPPLAAPVLQMALWCMQAQWWMLQQLAAVPGSQWYLPEPSALSFVLSLIGAFWLLLPRGVPLRWVGILLFLPLCWPRQDLPEQGEFDVVMMDVGQGLAVLVRTREHILVYDAGARYPSGFDLGEVAVVPTAHALGIGKIDRLIVSHGDNDHAGGAAAVAAALRPQRIESGQPERLRIPAVFCVAGESWIWNDVRFRMLGPLDPAAEKGNDLSCVLLIEASGARFLLTGDIGAEAEPGIAAALPPGPPLVLAVAHHGSRHSTHAEFLAATHPVLGLVSAGYRSRFGHPHADTVQRFRERGIELVNTADAGCLRLRLGAAGVHWQERCRMARHAYWREP
jgi:competence protein ComEC